MYNNRVGRPEHHPKRMPAPNVDLVFRSAGSVSSPGAEAALSPASTTVPSVFP